MYILLSGKPPFKGKTTKLIIKSVKKGKFTFEDEIWWKISPQAKELITMMLTKDSK